MNIIFKILDKSTEMTKKSTKMCFTKQVIGLTLEIETTAKLFPFLVLQTELVVRVNFKP